MHLIMHVIVKVSSDLMQSESSEYSHWLHIIGEIQQYVDLENHVYYNNISTLKSLKPSR